MMTATIQAQIESLLKDKMGWSATILGSKEIARAVEKRRVAENLPDMQTYLQQLQTSTQELEELIELLIVPETWFFRDWEPFTFLEGYVKSEWLPTKYHRILRVLSVPCSSGEEPYSIAMTLLNAGLASNQFQIDAVDISKNSLEKAREAVYSSNSFRVKNLEFQKLYFSKVGNKYQLHEQVKTAVNFTQANLIDASFMTDKNPYDVIFCRNVLIYFEDSARVKAIGTLNGLLKNEGLLFLGHAEQAQILASSFVSVQHPFAFAYRKKHNNTQISNKQLTSTSDLSSRLERKNNSPQFIDNSPIVKRKNTPIAKQGSTKLRTAFLSIPETPTKEITKVPNPIQMPVSNLETARKLADTGQLSEAGIMCETYLKQNSTSVEAYILLGQVYQAKGMESQAEQCFQKAVYLEPNNHDALLHLALLKEQSGELARAAVLRQRIQRLKNS
ncbi:MAG TPA: CheR family methyltransferase [Kamptonema sp.]|nr:CheR family methyltransferase [Kamptonema sp.]